MRSTVRAGLTTVASGLLPVLTAPAAGSPARAALRAAGRSLLGQQGRVRVLEATRHPLAPAAVRVERAQSRGRRRVADQVAVTVWFGEGPALPGPGGGGARSVLRLAAGLAGAAAMAGLGAAASQALAERQPRRLTAPARPALPPAD